MGSSNKALFPVAGSLDIGLIQEIKVRSKVLIVQNSNSCLSQIKERFFTNQGEEDLVTVTFSGQSHEVFIGEGGEELTGHFYIFILR